MAKNETQRIAGPAECRYAHLLTPDTEYDKDGKFQVELVYADRDAAGPLIREIEEEAAFALQEAERTSRGKKVKEAPLPIKELEDGRIAIKFASYAKGTDAKTKETFDRVIPIYGKDGKPWDRTKEIGNGSLLEIAWFGSAYNSPTNGAGATLRLKAVRVVKHVARAGKGAEGYGFKVEADEQDGEDEVTGFNSPAGENGDF
jgi:hypothetical protein